jgi:hypothetical protein
VGTEPHTWTTSVARRPREFGDGEQNRRVLECMQRVPRPGNDQEVAVASLPLGGVGNQPHPSPQHLDGRLAGILVLRQHRPRRSTRSASAAAHAHAHRRPSRRPGRPERSLPSSSGRGYAPRARTSPYRQCGHPAARPSITRTVRAGRHLRGGQIRALLPTKLSPRSLAGTRGWLLPPDTPAGGARSRRSSAQLRSRSTDLDDFRPSEYPGQT